MNLWPRHEDLGSNETPRHARITVLPIAFASGSFVYYLIFGLTYPRSPGIYYDEVLFINAATGGLRDDFVYRRLFGIPIMLMPYIGALKSYLYYPIFQVFGVSPETIRFPVVLISGLSLIVGFELGRTILGNWLGPAAAVLMATDPVYVYMSKLDFGPVVLMMLFKLLATLFLFKLIRTSSIRYLWLVVATTALGIFNKLDFIWFLIALTVASALMFGDSLLSIYRKNRAGFAASISLLVGGVVTAGILVVAPLLGGGELLTSPNWVDRFSQRAALYYSTVDGRSPYSLWSLNDLSTPDLVNVVTVLAAVGGLVVLGLAVFRSLSSQTAPKFGIRERSAGLFLLMGVLIFAQIVMTRDATGPHHIMMIYPFHLFFIVAVAGCVERALGERYRSAHAGLIGILLMSLMGSEILSGRTFYSAMAAGDQFSPRWTPAIYDLADFVDHSRADQVISVDWGIGNQIYALANQANRGRCLDLWPTFTHGENATGDEQIFRAFFVGRTSIVLLHPESVEVMKGNKARFLAFARKYTRSTRLVSVITDRNNEPMFEIYHVQG